jgi:hypothetical protein
MLNLGNIPMLKMHRAVPQLPNMPSLCVISLSTGSNFILLAVGTEHFAVMPKTFNQK